jgi:predicted phage gp36 major capsid-like protein
MDKIEKKLREQIAEAVDSMQALNDAADAEDRDLTDDEQKQFDDLDKESKSLKKRLERHVELKGTKAALGLEDSLSRS